MIDQPDAEIVHCAGREVFEESTSALLRHLEEERLAALDA